VDTLFESYSARRLLRMKKDNKYVSVPPPCTELVSDQHEKEAEAQGTKDRPDDISAYVDNNHNIQICFFSGFLYQQSIALLVYFISLAASIVICWLVHHPWCHLLVGAPSLVSYVGWLMPSFTVETEIEVSFYFSSLTSRPPSSVAERLRRRLCNQKIAGSNPASGHLTTPFRKEI